MPSVHVSETIHAPRDLVFALFSDLSGFEERIRGIESAELRTGSRKAVEFTSKAESLHARLLSPLASMATKTVARRLREDIDDPKAIAEAEPEAARAGLTSSSCGNRGQPG